MKLLAFVIPLLLANLICAPRVFSQQPPAEEAWPSPRGTTQSTPGAPANAPANLVSRYEVKEQKAAQLARQIRGLQTAPKEHEWAIKDLSSQLRQAVTEAFAARQQLHEAEVGQLRDRISGIQQSLKMRDRLSKEIIDKRVKDLLNPDLQWDHSSPDAPREEPNAKNTSATRAVRDKLQERWKQVEKLFEFGRVPLAETLQAAKDLNEADIAGAASENEDREARQAALDRLKQIKSIVDAKVAEGAEPERHKLTVDAEVLKAEAELTPSQKQPSDWRATAGGDKTAAAPPAGGETSRAATRAYRDLLRRRLELLQGGYRTGEFPYSDFMRALIELDDAEIAAAATAEERHAARKAKLDHLKEASVLIERKVTSGEVTPTDLLGAQAEVLKAKAEQLKAEAELAAESTPGTAAAPPAAPMAAPPAAGNLVVGGSSPSITLRRPDEFREEFITRESFLKQLKSKDPKEYNGDPATIKKQIEDAIQRAQRELDFLRDEYATQIHLLELEAKDAASAVESAQKSEEIAKSLYQQGRAHYGQINEAQRAREAATLRQERANALLELYRKADPKQALPPATTGEAAVK